MWKTNIQRFFSLIFIFIVSVSTFTEAKATKPPKSKNKKAKMEEMVMDTSTIFPLDLILDYNAVPTAYFDLIHTKLELLPSLNEKKLLGKATIDLKPRFYNQSQIILDAKGMEINKVQLLDRKTNNSESLIYQYDGFKLMILLPQVVSKKDTIRLWIDYVAKPYELDSNTVKMGRGMYFINALNKNPYKPTHVWTQGESVAASCWFPTLDVNYQKTTEEIYITVEDKYTTFSNGLLKNSQKNADGTRTDYWKQDKPHAPYLFVVAFGEYMVYKDHWRDIPVNYYTFPKYFKDVDKVFGKTPEMMEFFSEILGVDYPWDKYDQIVTYDYTNGAMENTGASVFYEPLFCKQQDLVDRDYEYIIAHELFHQWFGDLVSCEYWSQLTLNESFANYSEYLWAEYSKGVQSADVQWYKDLNGYLKEFYTRKKEPIVNYYFENPDDVFDNHRYEKGGIVLHMLRKYIGDEAFFVGLSLYLKKHAFKATEIHDLRIVFEEITGEDLNWFFNQWWMSSGHPILNITQKYHEGDKTLEMTVVQRQKNVDENAPNFKFPIDIEIYLGDSVVTKKVWVDQKKEVFYFSVPTAPNAINIDPGKYLLAEINLQQSSDAYAFVFDHSNHLLDKIMILDILKDKQAEEVVKNVFLKALKDKFWFVREHAASLLEVKSYTPGSGINDLLLNIIAMDNSPFVREKVIKKIEIAMPEKTAEIAEMILQKDSSFNVLSAALDALNTKSNSKAYSYAQQLKVHENPVITISVARVIADSAQVEDYDFFERSMYLQGYRSSTAINKSFEKYLLKTDLNTFSKGIELMKSYIKYEETYGNIKNVEKALSSMKTALQEADASKKYKDSKSKLNILEN